MAKQRTFSMRTRINWLIDAFVFGTGVVAGLSAIYFLIVPSGGYQGGRNPWYGSIILFERASWDDLHTWGGILMIIAVVVHLVYHWDWVVMISKRALKAIRSRETTMSKGTKMNLMINIVVVLSFVFTAISGIYLLFAPSGGYQGGANPSWDWVVLFHRATWDLIHTWSGVVMIVSVMVHFAIHWRWVTKVTTRFLQSLSPWPKPRQSLTGSLKAKKV